MARQSEEFRVCVGRYWHNGRIEEICASCLRYRVHRRAMDNNDAHGLKYICLPKPMKNGRCAKKITINKSTTQN